MHRYSKIYNFWWWGDGSAGKVLTALVSGPKLNSQKPCIVCGTYCNSSTGETLETHWPDSLVQLVNSRPVRDLVTKNKGGGA